MSTATYLVGDVFDRLAEIPDGSVDLVMTSPPFLALRSYLPAGHPDKGKEIGQEPTPAAFIDTLLALTAEWRRVLAPHGSIAVELGDTYSGSGGGGGDYLPGGLREGQPGFGGSAEKQREGNAAHWRAKNVEKGAWPLAKSMVGIPHLYHLSLAYGRNLLTGQPSPAGQWRVRNVVAWVRPNPPVGALGDKFRPATSYVTIACTSQRRYFDLDAVRTPLPDGVAPAPSSRGATEFERDAAKARKGTVGMDRHPAGAPPLDWWEIPTQPYSGSHYATFPEALVVRPIEAMCPRKVCRVCGKPSERIVEKSERYAALREAVGDFTDKAHREVGSLTGSRSDAVKAGGYDMTAAEYVTLGWTDCGCSDDGSHWRPGLVLDPFAGSGTTLAVATARGRDAIGIDLDERNLDLARERIGMWLQEDVA